MSRTTILLAGIALFLLCLPLALRLIPLNHFYGYRTAVSMRSEENWYAMNAGFGWRGMLWSLPIIVLGAAGWFIPDSYGEGYTRYSPFIIGGIVILAFITISLWSRRFSS